MTLGIFVPNNYIHSTNASSCTFSHFVINNSSNIIMQSLFFNYMCQV